MRLLLDTHFVIWWLGASSKLGAATRQLIERSDCAVSVASLIEVRMLVIRGKLKLPPGENAHRQLSDEGFSILALKPEHVEESARFEQRHSDIYDRLLLASAGFENRMLLTRDAALLALAQEARLGWVVEG